jgi:hypothetical protein
MDATTTPRANNHEARGSDKEQLRRGLELLADPDAGFQLWTWPGKRKAHHKGSDVDGIAESVRRNADQTGIYAVLNPLPVSFDEYAKNKDVLKRRWLFIDIDPIKAEGFDDDCATDEEHEQTRQAAEVVRDHLAGLGWPAPMLVDSGNGWYLLYRIDLDNTKHSQALIRSFLEKLRPLIEGKGKIDRAVHDARRIARLPGTMNRKGRADLPERPHRLCRLVFVPKELEIVSAEQIAAVAGHTAHEANTPANGTAKKGLILKAGTSGANAYVRRAMELECAAVASAPAGERNNRLNKAAYNLGGFIPQGYLAQGEIETRLTEAARSCGLDKDSGCGERGIWTTIQSGIEAGSQNVRYVRDNHAGAAAQHQAGESASDTATEPWAAPSRSLVFRTLVDVQPLRPSWLWRDRIPLAAVSILDGDPELGKSTIAADLGARVSRGGAMPPLAGGTDLDCPADVLILNGEDTPETTIRPRLDAAGADVSRVHVVEATALDSTDERPPVLPTDLDLLEELARAKNVKLIVVDPFMAYLGGELDAHRDQDVRRCLHRLKILAERTGAAVLLVRHLNKLVGGPALYRGGGSIGIIGAARSALLVGKHPANPEQKVLAPVKCNLCRKPSALTYSIETAPNGASVIGWGEETTLTADDLLGHKRQGGGVAEQCAEELRVLLSDGPRAVEDVEAELKANGFTPNAIRQARRQTRATAKRDGGLGSAGRWTLCLPEDNDEGEIPAA